MAGSLAPILDAPKGEYRLLARCPNEFFELSTTET